MRLLLPHEHALIRHLHSRLRQLSYEASGHTGFSPDTHEHDMPSFLDLPDTPDSYAGEAGNSAKVNATEDALEFGAAGAATFLELTDTPASYAEEAGKYAKVNATEDALEFGAAGAATFLELTDTPASYAGEAGKYAKVNAGADALEFGAITEAGVGSIATSANSAATTPVTLNRGYFKKIDLGVALTISTLSCYLGSPVAGTIELGVYSSAGVKLASGTSSQATTGIVTVSITPQTVGPGPIWLAFVQTVTREVRFSSNWSAPSSVQGYASACYPLPSSVPALTQGVHIIEINAY